MTYQQRAEQYKPTGQELRTEIHRLHRDGLTARDISEHLNIGLNAVVVVLLSPPIHTIEEKSK